MKGRHTVRRFTVEAGEDLKLPSGWKPFAAWPIGSGYITVVARKWERET